MRTDRGHVPVSARAADCGLTWPGPGGWWDWLADRQFLLALLAAVPAWALLGLTVGPRMHLVTGWDGWISFLLLQPLAEELVFRGVLQGQWLRWSAARRVGPVTRASLGVTAAFVALHFLVQPPLWALAVALPSLVFGHLGERFGSVLPAVVVHAVYNAGFAVTA